MVSDLPHLTPATRLRSAHRIRWLDKCRKSGVAGTCVISTLSGLHLKYAFIVVGCAVSRVAQDYVHKLPMSFKLGSEFVENGEKDVKYGGQAIFSPTNFSRTCSMDVCLLMHFLCR